MGFIMPEHIIMQSIARRLDAGTYLPRPRQAAPIASQNHAPNYVGAALCGVLLALAFMVRP
jgi:hypothetical protein